MFLKSVFLLFGSLFLLTSVILLKQRADYYDLEAHFDEYLKKYNKTYNNETIYNERLQAFQMSFEKINHLNAMRIGNASAYYGLTKYSDLTILEFSNNILQQDYSQGIRARNRKKKPNNDASSEEDSGEAKRFISRRSLRDSLPVRVDWREKGAVTKVNNQGSCGACWAFSLIETIESIHAIATGNLTQLSVQQMIDCAGNQNDGCNGGDMCFLAKWLLDTDMEILPEDKYPLHLKTEVCAIDKKRSSTKDGGATSEAIRLTDYDCDSLVGNEDILLAVLAQRGPVAVAVNALLWQHYIDGVIQYHCHGHPLLLNHSVQIVGYDLGAQVPHYIVRNSWGEDWAELGGYVHVAVGDNVCGIANEVVAISLL